MDNSKILNKRDVIIEDGKIQFVLNENYSYLMNYIDYYFSSLLLDIRLNLSIGYSFYNTQRSYPIKEYGYDESRIKNIQLSKEDIKYLQSLILKYREESIILNEFYRLTTYEYKILDTQLRIYIDIINEIIVNKLI